MAQKNFLFERSRNNLYALSRDMIYTTLSPFNKLCSDIVCLLVSYGNTHLLQLQPQSSVTIFGEISPLWHNFKSLEQIFEGLFCIWQDFYPTLAKSHALGQVFIAADGQILKLFSHLVTLAPYLQSKKSKLTKVCRVAVRAKAL